jgi:hypothetical protein
MFTESGLPSFKIAAIMEFMTLSLQNKEQSQILKQNHYPITSPLYPNAVTF